MAWCAGFFDSEGCATRHLGRLILQAKHPVPEPLERLRHNLNGKVYGPYFEVKDHGEDDGLRTERYYIWQVSGESAQAAAMVLAPLSTCKRRQLEKLL